MCPEQRSPDTSLGEEAPQATAPTPQLPVQMHVAQAVNAFANQVAAAFRCPGRATIHRLGELVQAVLNVAEHRRDAVLGTLRLERANRRSDQEPDSQGDED